MSGKGLSEPPEGVVAGENVPVENQQAQMDESEIQEFVGMLKARGEPYTEMKDKELRKKAKRVINNHG